MSNGSAKVFTDNMTSSFSNASKQVLFADEVVRISNASSDAATEAAAPKKEPTATSKANNSNTTFFSRITSNLPFGSKSRSKDKRDSEERSGERKFAQRRSNPLLKTKYHNVKMQPDPRSSSALENTSGSSKLSAICM